MEALGLVASLVNILQGIDSVWEIARANVHSSVSASKEYGLLLGKLTVYRGIIEGLRLQTEIDQTNHGRISALTYATGPLHACQSAVKLIENRLKNLPKHILLGKIIDKDISRCLQTFDEALPILQLALDAEQRVITSAVESYIQSIGTEVSVIRELTESNAQHVSNIKQLLVDDQQLQLKNEQEAERAALRQWLRRCDPEAIYLSVIDLPVSGSGAWFTGSVFPDWLTGATGNGKQMMWLRGSSGAGKTTLTSLAIKNVKSQDRGQPFAYFFCSFNNKDSQRCMNMLASYVAQLCEQIPELWTVAGKTASYIRGTELKDTDEDDLIRTITATCGMCDEILLFLDAPNECDRHEDLLEIIGKLVETNPNLKILLSSTEDIMLNIPCQNVLAVTMDQEHISYDLYEYLTWKTKNERRLRRLDTALQDKIINTLVSRAERSFRWAVCQLLAITEHARSEAAIERSLRTLSRSLEELYTESLLSIPAADVPLVQNALMWLAFAIRPMHLQEVSEAMTFREGLRAIDAADRLFTEEAEDLIRKCRMLIDYNVDDQTVKLAHSSVKDYLVGENCKLGSAGIFYLERQMIVTKLANLTLDYLNLDVFAAGYCPTEDQLGQRKNEYPLGDYISEAWCVYVENSPVFLPVGASAFVPLTDPEGEALKLAVQKFLSSANDESLPRGGNYGSWVQYVFPRHIEAGIDPRNHLYYAARNDMQSMVKLILDLGNHSCLEIKGGSRHSTPLHAAASFGHLDMVSLLLARGADPNEKNGFGERGIEWAAYYGDDKVVKLLLSYGAEPLSQEGMDRIHEFVKRIEEDSPTYYVAKEAMGSDGYQGGDLSGVQDNGAIKLPFDSSWCTGLEEADRSLTDIRLW